MKYIFKWVMSTGYDSNTFKEKRPIPDCGSDALMWVDSRLSITSIKAKAEEWIAKTGGIGYSVGYLQSHDPDNRYIQSILPFTKL